MPDSSAPDRPLVAVVGAGIAGLAAARLLAGSGRVRTVLLESSARLGGKVGTGDLGGQVVELGPDQFLRRDPSMERLCRELGLGEDLVAPAGRGAGLYSYGALRALPARLVLGVPLDLEAVAASGIVSDAGIERARRGFSGGDLGGGRPISAAAVGLDPESGERERSAGEVLRSLLGDEVVEVVDRLVDPLLGGINAGSVDSLSLGIAARQIAQGFGGADDPIGAVAAAVPPPGSTAPPSPFLGLRGGLARIVSACAAELADHGAEVHCDAQVTALAVGSGGAVTLETAGRTVVADGVVLAVPGPSLARLLRSAAPDGAAAAADVAYASVAVTTFAYEPQVLGPSNGWTGFLVPRVEGRLMTAVTYLSDKWPWMSPTASSLRFVRVSAGRFSDERIGALSDDELAAALVDELAEVAGLAGRPTAWGVARYPGGFPQYRPGHSELVRRIVESLAGFGQVRVAGAVLGGIGLPACVSSGEQAAARVLAALGP